MTDVKISQLPAATTPLAGTELVPIVQGGVTKQVAIGGTIPASQIINTPSGTLAATTVQAAINEIVSDNAASSGSSLVGFLQSGTGAVATTVQTKLRESVSVKDFGAVGDGTTDDTVAIQAAVTYAAANNFILTGTGTGTCLITSTISISSGVVNWANLKTKSSGITTHCFALSGTVSSVDITGCSFDANNQAYAHLRIDSLSNVNINNNTFKNSYGVGTSYGVWIRDTSQVLVSGNTFDGASGAVPRLLYIQHVSTGCKDVVVTANTFANITSTATDGDAIVCEDYTFTAGSVVVSNNTFRNIYKRAVKAGGSNWVIEGNLVYDCKNYSVFSLYGPANFIVSDNIVECTTSIIDYPIDVGVTATVTDVLITNNTFKLYAATSGTQDFIRATGTSVTNLVVIGNTVDYCRYFLQKASSTTLTGAVFYGNKSTECFDHEFSLSAGTVSSLSIQNHTSVKSVTSRALLASFATTSNVDIVNCTFNKTTGLSNNVRMDTAFGNVNAGALVQDQVYSEGYVRGYRSSAPASGTYILNDIFYNTAPASAGFIGWVCTVAGTPGTWKTFGLIS